MSINLQHYTAFSGRIDRQKVGRGSLSEPVSISVNGDYHIYRETIANGANAAIYSNTLTSFSYMYVASDVNTRLLITDSAANTFSLRLRGSGTTNKPGVPLCLGLDGTSSGEAIVGLTVYNDVNANTSAYVVAELHQ